MKKTNLLLGLAFLAQMPFAAQVTKLRVMPQFKAIAFAAAPKGSTFAAALENKTIRIINASNGQTLRTLEGHKAPAYALAFSTDGKFIASGDESAQIILWEVATGKKIRNINAGHTKGLQTLAFSKDNTLIVSTAKDDTLVISKVGNGSPVKKVAGNGMNFTNAFFNDGTIITSTLGAGTRFINTKKGYETTASFDGHAKTGVMDLALNSTGTKAFTAGRDYKALVWNLQKKQVVLKCQGHQDWVMHTALNHAGTLGATSSTDRTVIVWNINNGNKICQFQNQSYVGSPLAFTADGLYLLTTNESDSIQINKVTK